MGKKTGAFKTLMLQSRFFQSSTANLKLRIQALRTWLWFASWKGALHDSALFNALMEYWSVGVLEYWSNGKAPLSEFLENQIYGDHLKVQSSFFKDQHSNTPLLQHSFALFEAEPIISDLTLRTRFSKIEYILFPDY